MSKGRPPLPEADRRTTKLTARATSRLAAAAHQVATAEGRSVAALVRRSVQEYCAPRLRRS